MTLAQKHDTDLEDKELFAQDINFIFIDAPCFADL